MNDFLTTMERLEPRMSLPESHVIGMRQRRSDDPNVQRWLQERTALQAAGVGVAVASVVALFAIGAVVAPGEAASAEPAATGATRAGSYFPHQFTPAAPADDREQPPSF